MSNSKTIKRIYSSEWFRRRISQKSLSKLKRLSLKMSAELYAAYRPSSNVESWKLRSVELNFLWQLALAVKLCSDREQTKWLCNALAELLPQQKQYFQLKVFLLSKEDVSLIEVPEKVCKDQNLASLLGNNVFLTRPVTILKLIRLRKPRKTNRPRGYTDGKAGGSSRRDSVSMKEFLKDFLSTELQLEIEQSRLESELRLFSSLFFTQTIVVL